MAPNIFYGTGLAPAVVVLRRSKPAARKDKVLIVDASRLFRKGRAQNFLDPEHAEQIVMWARAFGEVPDRARVVSLDEIEAENWTLNISRYVLPPIGEDIPPLSEAVAAFKHAIVESRAAEERLRKVLLSGGWLDTGALGRAAADLLSDVSGFQERASAGLAATRDCAGILERRPRRDGLVQDTSAERAQWQLWAVDVATGRDRRLSNVDLPLGTENVVSFSLHPDGTRFLTSAGGLKTDIWMLKGFDRH